MTMNRVRVAFVGLGFAALAAGCGGGVEGTYGEATGSTQIVLKSGGAATMSFMNDKMDCTYTAKEKKVTLDCKQGTPLELTLSDDGTVLQMPPGSMIPNLKKQ